MAKRRVTQSESQEQRTLFDVAVGTVVGFLAAVVAMFVTVVVGDRLRPRHVYPEWFVSIQMTVTILVGFLVGGWCIRALAVGRVERQRRQRDESLKGGKCPVCGYSLYGLPEPRCPECGERFTAAECSKTSAAFTRTAAPVGPVRDQEPEALAIEPPESRRQKPRGLAPLE